MLHNSRKVAPAIALVCALAAPARGDGDDKVKSGQSVALGQVLQVAVRNNPALDLATIDVEAADAQLVAAAGLDDWVLGVGVSASQLRNSGLSSTVKTIEASVGLTRSLPFGGVVGFGFRSTWSNNPFFLTTDYTQAPYVSYSQALWRGRGREVARATQRQAEIVKDAAVLARDAAAIVVIRDVVNAYWALAYAIRDIEIRRSSLVLAQERLRITKAGISAGSIAPTEALAVEQIIATREEEIIAAEVVVSQRSLELRRLAGMEIGPGAIDLDIVAPLTVEARDFAVAELLERAYQSSPTLARLAAAKASADIDVEVAADQTDPRLDAKLDFGPLGIHPKFGEALGNITKFDDYSVSGSLSYEQSLGNSAAKGAERQARASLHRAKISLADARVDIAMAMIQAIQSARAADKRMLISERAIVLAEKNIDAEKARFELGRSTNFDIAQRQDELKRAQLLYARAAADYLSAVAFIDSLTGDLLGKYGIKMDDKE